MVTTKDNRGQRAFLGFARLLVVPFVVLNLTAGIIGGIWLIAIGKWPIAVGGLVASMLFPFVYTVVGLPGIGIAAISAALLERRRVLIGAVLGAVSSIYTYALVAGWLFIVWVMASSLWTELGSLASLLYGYSVATGPFAYMASKDPPDSTASTIATLFAQVSYVVLTAATLLGAAPLGVSIVLLFFTLLQIGGFLVTLRLGWSSQGPGGPAPSVS